VTAFFKGDRVVARLGDCLLVGLLRAVGARHVVIDIPGDRTGHVLQTPPWVLHQTR
jgi:hypothetical protein